MPTVEDTNCPQVAVDGSDPESLGDLRGVGCDVDDPQSQDEDHPHSDESVASSRMGASVVEEEGAPTRIPFEDGLNTSSSTIFPGRGAITTGFESLDTVDLAEIWKVRAILMQSVPKFLDGVFGFAVRQALDS